jgi:predicted tellurium resistance membrane protein TerC
MPYQLTTKALVLVVIAQICFQCGIYMGLSNWLATQTWLPYALGVWLLYLGVASLFQDHSGHTDDVSVDDFWVVKAFSTLCCGRFKPRYLGEHSLFVWQDHKCYATMLVLVTGVLVLVDFTLEVDVTLVKIECISNPYIAFSSSAVAAFSVPELFFVVRMLFERYSALKYGISFILMMFGLELILESVFTVPALAGCGATLLVMVFCICISPPPEPGKVEEAAATATEPRQATPARATSERLLRQSPSGGCLALASQPTTHPLAAPGHGRLVPGGEEGRRRLQTIV